ncbi:MAG: hypothetical protein R6W66_05450 [Pelovirga sp.]
MNQQVEIDALRAGSSQEKIPRHYSTSAAARALLRKRFLKKNTPGAMGTALPPDTGRCARRQRRPHDPWQIIAKIAEIKGFLLTSKELRRQAVSIDSSSFFLL